MLTTILQPYIFIKGLINRGHSRSVKAKKNIVAAFFIRGLSIPISFVLIPLTINFVNPSIYGIWLTLGSIVAWFSFFDIGLTQGLRNKFAAAKANGDDDLAQIYVSTTYAILSIIFFIVWIIFLIVNHFLNWSHILNISENMQSEVSTLAVIVFTYFCLQFILRVITTLLVADQQPAKSSFIDLLGQFLSLIIIVILVKTTKGSLIRLCIGSLISPLILLIGANIFFYRGIFKKYRPRFSKIKFSYAKSLFNLGVVFFIIQVAAIIQYESANIIIARNFGTAEVTAYNIVYKYFGILSMVFAIFLTPFWSASTEAFAKNDLQWIKNGIRKYNQLNILMFIGSCGMLLFSDIFYRFWLGHGKVPISFSLSFWGFMFFNVGMFGSKYVNFLNGINALRMQFWTSLISPFLYVLVAYILIHYYKLGVSALFIAAVIANANAYIVAPLQYYKIMNGKKGIWIR